MSSSITKLEFSDGTYEGEYTIVDGVELAHGKGKYTYNTGDIYEGEFKEDMLHGKGTYTWSDGMSYTGDWFENAQHGYGVLKDPTEGEEYRGDWQNDVRHGQGVCETNTAQGKAIYDGQWVDNQRHGWGKMTFSDGSRYEGQWADNLRHGQGLQEFPNGVHYDGAWVRGKQCGFGKQKMPTGDLYEGNFLDDVFDGYGKYIWPDGRRFVGYFKSSVKHGKGKEYTSEGDIYEGTWIDGVPGPDVVFRKASVDTSPSDVALIRAAIAAVDISDKLLPPIVTPAKVSGGLSPSASPLSPPTGELAEIIRKAQSEFAGQATTASIRPTYHGDSVASPNTAVSSLLESTSLGASLNSVTFSMTSRGVTMEDLQNYNTMNLLGRGSFGAAYEAILPRSGRMVCVKVIELSNISDASALAALYNEIALMQRLHHPNIVEYYGCTRNETKNTLNIFMEYITGGSLVTYAKKFKVIPAPLIRRWAYQMVVGVRYLHANKVIHRDIKGENILMTNDGVIKLADFGCSKALDGVSAGTQGCHSMVGTPYWMAPEVITCSKDATSSYGTKADIWSVGCTIIEMITGRPPWPECNSVWRAVYQIANSTGPPDIPSTIDGKLREFLLAIFERDPNKRPSAEELLKHPYLDGYAGD